MISVTASPLVGRFHAMACPCEVLVDTDDEALAAGVFAIAQTEAGRIEAKFSRYKTGNIIHRINTSRGTPVTVDEETAQLLDFAAEGYRLSDGLFDITTGALRRAWTFDRSDRVPSEKTVRDILERVGWDKAVWKRHTLTLRPGMEIDLGGIGKEYAVDRALGLIRQKQDVRVLVNFGGDIAARGPRRSGEPWRVGIESIHEDNVASRLIQLNQGALATSGDAKKFILRHGKRYGHILNPRTGYPVENAPRSVTVAAGSCSEAGFLSTLGMLQGQNAETFLQQSNVRFWCSR